MIYRKIFNRMYLLILVAITLLFFFQLKAEAAELPDISAKAFVLMDEDSGRVLFAQDAHQRMPQASLTKIMTALLVIENGDLDKKVVSSKHAEETGGSSIWLEEGEVLSRSELLYSLMLASANDAAVALSESVGGNEKYFVEQMNNRVRKLNLSNTHFANPHGLDAEGHYSSAFDLAYLTRECLKVPLFREVVATKQMNVPWPNHPWERSLYNKNKLLARYQGARGVKTGYTNNAGSCFVGAAQRGDIKLISVVLKSSDTYGDTEKLLDYGFNNYESVVLVEKEKTNRIDVKKGIRKSIPVQLERNAAAVVLPEEKGSLSYKTEIAEEIRAPVMKGDVLGKVRIFLNGQEIDQVNYLALENVPKKPPFWIAIINWFTSLFS